MSRLLPHALIAAVCLAAAAGKLAAEEPTYFDDEKFAADFSRKLIDLAKQGKCLKAEDLQRKLAHGRAKVAWKQPGSHPMKPQEVYRHALPAVFVLGSVQQLPDKPDQWQDGRLATAWALTEDGVLATNWHVFDKMGKERYGVVNYKGEVFPVVDALGADPTADIALVRVAGKGFTPLPLAADEKVGAWVAVLSHPGNQFFTFTQGHVTRYTQNSSDGKRQRWMSLTADFAYGSSGAPVLNRFGAVVGMATVTANIDYPLDELSAETPGGNNEGPPKPPEKPPEKTLHKSVEKAPAKPAQKPEKTPETKPEKAAEGQPAEVETSLVQMVVKLAVPGRTIQEFCTEPPAPPPAGKK
jgi:S1-C subfamily serine protease